MEFETQAVSADLCSRIEAEYERSANTYCWRFLYSPATTLRAADVAFIGLNPGGSGEDAAQGCFAMDRGSAYRDESWAGHPSGKSPLQKQVLTLFERLGQDPERVLAGATLCRFGLRTGRASPAAEFTETPLTAY